MRGLRFCLFQGGVGYPHYPQSYPHDIVQVEKHCSKYSVFGEKCLLIVKYNSFIQLLAVFRGEKQIIQGENGACDQREVQRERAVL